MNDEISLFGYRVRIAKTCWERLRGLIGTRDLAADEGLLIPHCNAIHTLFMSFAIDAIFLDQQNQIVKIAKNIRPGRFWVWGGFRARKVLEVKSRKFEPIAKI